MSMAFDKNEIQRQSWLRGEMTMGEPVGQSEPPILAQEKAMVEAAKALRREKGVSEITPYLAILDKKFAELCDAVDALPQPQPVSPDQLKPGDRFKFPKSGNVGVVMTVPGIDAAFYRYEEGGTKALRLLDGQLVIPIQEDQE